jgi:hypothetical protein
MKIVIFGALALAIGSSPGQADHRLGASARAGDARFAAMSLTTGQGARAIISNVLASANGTDLAPCPVRVSFFGADGSLIGDATKVQLKAGESTSVLASQPSQLVRATVSIGDVVDQAKVCELRTRVEIFDVQTDTTFVSVSGESIGGNSECSLSAAPTPVAARDNVSGRENSDPIATTSSLSGSKVSPKNRSNRRSRDLATTPPSDPK